ncbi:nicotinate-nucleotide--dimethylbenzimidazole phosphoribosyltransferase [Clostridiales bacterium]|nr:nicotinate-nucleotide--dimethylbenzimidazole phosphoribosyltransferase [Clostridiales bacterium]
MNLKYALENLKTIDVLEMGKAEKHWLSIVKPLFSLGRLETAITKMAGINGKADFSIKNKTLVIMCADNGVVEEGVAQCGQSVTATVAKSFMEGKSSVCIMAERTGVDILPVDAGMATDIGGMESIKNAYGTENISKGPAMSRNQCIEIMEKSIDLAGKLADSDCNIILTGEMGIGNTTTAAAVTAALLDKSASEVTGRGAGLSSGGLEKKIETVKKALEVNIPNKTDPIDIISKVGGFDIAAMTGLFIGGAVHGVPVVIDGLISSVAALAAVRINENIRDFILPSHLSSEPAGSMLLTELGLEPYITCGMFLGEGSGAVAVMPLFDMAMDIYKSLGTFDNWEHEAYKVLE